MTTSNRPETGKLTAMQDQSILSEAEISEIRAAASHYPQPSAASIEALKIVQKHRRWVSNEALEAIAGLLGISTAELDSVATFYNLIYRKPVGESVIHYCNSVTCWMLGADSIAEHIGKTLNIRPGETTQDNRYTLLPIVCLGHCDHAPAIMIGDKTYGDLDKSVIDGILNGATGHE